MKLTTTAIIALSATTAAAGGLAPPISERPVARPTVSANPPMFTSWEGPYARLSYQRQSVTREDMIVTETRETPLIETPITETCEYDPSKGTHSGRKCRGLYEYAGNADLNALPYGNWNGCNAAVCAFGYDENGNVTDIWLEAYEPFTFQTGTLIEEGQEIVARAIDYFNEEFDESAIGLSIGQRWQSGNVVYGGELGVTRNLVAETNLFTAEGQLGYSIAAALPYISAGFANDGDDSGAIWGAGVDLQIGNGMFVGAKYSQADVLGLEGVSVSVGVSW